MKQWKKSYGCGHLLLALTSLFVPRAIAVVSCNDTLTCFALIGEGSKCLSAGFCSNPFHTGGCLENMMDPEKLRERRSFLRACHSEDPPEAQELGHCQASLLDYTEVRIHGQNWESSFFSAWILQILLSELLQVPTTVESGTADAKLDFYDVNMPMGYGTANDLDALRTGRQVGDCRRVQNQNKDDESYTPCAHLFTEAWFGVRDDMMMLYREDVVELTSGLGALGQESWYIPRHLAMKDPSLLTYLGLQGQQNRHKLAATFLRPTSWLDYCEWVSANNCATPDGVAERAPDSEDEGSMYFVEGAFTGFFRNTTQNDCEAWPDNCTGHIVDYPCGWSSAVKQQAYHLDIAVESNGPEPGSGGYSYAQMTQIVAAANHTKSNLLTLWWTPEALYQQYFGTDMEFQRVGLTPPTQECVDHMIDPLGRCADNFTMQVGDPKGACDQPPQVLVKVVGNALFDISFKGKTRALQSPAYDLVKNFQITDLQYAEIFQYWLDRGVDKWNFDPRWAVCQWVVDHFDELEGFVPRTYPRTLEEEAPLHESPLHLASVAAASLAMVLTLITSVVTHHQRRKEAVRYAQIEFLWLLLVGLLLVSLTALLTAIPPTNAVCVAVIWLSNFGYTLELVPLVLKIFALHQLFSAARQMRRIALRKEALFGAVIVISVLVGVTLAVWTAIDRPHKNMEVELSHAISDDGEYTIIEQSSYCGQDKEFWDLLGVSWQAFLLFCASILAFQTRKVRKDFNEARTLAVLIYSHFVLAIMRSLTYVVDLRKSDLAAARSLIYSTDVIATIFIYFLPKFVSTSTPIPDPPAKASSWSDELGHRVNQMVMQHVLFEPSPSHGLSMSVRPAEEDDESGTQRQQQRSDATTQQQGYKLPEAVPFRPQAIDWHSGPIPSLLSSLEVKITPNRRHSI